MNAKDAFTKLNMRNTAGKRAVLAVVSMAKTPASVHDIENASQIKKLKLDQATIYRIVNALTKTGILHAVNFQEGKSRYELASNPHHHHVVCTNCGQVKDVEDCLEPTAVTTIEKQTGYTIASHSLEFFGLCKACQN